jgi:hypothetical protein
MVTKSETFERWLDLIEFVEDHGGALSGESRDKFNELVIAYAQAIFGETTL